MGNFLGTKLYVTIVERDDTEKHVVKLFLKPIKFQIFL